jgi:hypothetical protein
MLLKTSDTSPSGISHNTAEFAVNSLVNWWKLYGRPAFHTPTGPTEAVATDTISVPGKRNLQDRLCDAFGLSVTMSHYPPACSKWNPVEYRLFSHISMNWAGQPLRNLDVMLAFIGGTTTTAGLKVKAHLDPGFIWSTLADNDSW